MTKFYRTVQETPSLIAGAILSSNHPTEPYRAVDALFVKQDGLELGNVNPLCVENNPDWFERVWPVDGVYYNNLAAAQTAALAKAAPKESK